MCYDKILIIDMKVYIRKLKKGKFSMKKVMRNAFWMSPTGELIEVPATHQKLIIAFAKEDPTIFGWTTDEIIKVYEKHKEMKWFGFEGTNSRTELVLKCLKSGWTRLRFHSRPTTCWHIQVDNLNEKVAKNIINSFLQPIQKKLVCDFTAKSYNPSIMILDSTGQVLLKSDSVSEAIKALQDLS